MSSDDEWWVRKGLGERNYRYRCANKGSQSSSAIHHRWPRQNRDHIQHHRNMRSIIRILLSRGLVSDAADYPNTVKFCPFYSVND